MTDQELQETKQAVQVMAIQMQTLAQLPAVKQFIELSEKRELLIRTLPKEQKEGGDE
jgi:hypothetical protein